MASMNKVILIGRLTRDPELRYTASGKELTSFSIAVDRRFKNPQGERQTDFFRCKAWGQTALFVSNYVTKGRLVAVEGRIENSESVGPDGQKRYFTDIVCDNVNALDSARDSGQAGQAQPSAPAMEAGGAPRIGEPVQPVAAAPSAAAAYPEDFDESDPFSEE